MSCCNFISHNFAILLENYCRYLTGIVRKFTVKILDAYRTYVLIFGWYILNVPYLKDMVHGSIIALRGMVRS